VADEKEKATLPGRRRLLQGLAGGAGAAMAWPAFATEHPIHRHLENDAALDAARAAAEAPGAHPQFLDAHQLETLASLAERIVPGSGTARVAPFVDRLVSVDTQENQKELLQSIGAFDGAAIARHGHPWKALSEEQQVVLLTEAAAMRPSRPPTGRRADKPANPSRVDPGVRRTLRDSFESLKGWVVGAYYSSEVGLREMGYTGTAFFETYPGCPHPDGHAG
jgi:Gluconate 2-dehydrogenase subunit 3